MLFRADMVTLLSTRMVLVRFEGSIGHPAQRSATRQPRCAGKSRMSHIIALSSWKGTHTLDDL